MLVRNAFALSQDCDLRDPLASQKICLLQTDVGIWRGAARLSNVIVPEYQQPRVYRSDCIGFDHACVLISDTLSEAYPPIPGSTVESLAAIGKSSNICSVFVRGPHLHCHLADGFIQSPTYNFLDLAQHLPAASRQILAALHAQKRFTHTFHARTALTNAIALLAEQTLGDDANPAVIACTCYQIALICNPKRDASTTLNLSQRSKLRLLCTSLCSISKSVPENGRGWSCRRGSKPHGLVNHLILGRRALSLCHGAGSASCPGPLRF